jgi:hypothetical protein
MLLDEYLLSGMTSYELISKVASFFEEHGAPVFSVNSPNRIWIV